MQNRYASKQIKQIINRLTQICNGGRGESNIQEIVFKVELFRKIVNILKVGYGTFL